MPHGIIRPARHLIVHGTKHNQLVLGNTAIPGVSRDVQSNVYVPANATEWTNLLAAAGDAVGGPTSVYLCQEASGNLADSVGAFPLTATGTGLTYAQAVPGWARLGILANDGGTGVFTSTDAALPDISLASCAWLLYFSATLPVGGNRVFCGMGTTTTVTALSQITTGFDRIIAGSSAIGLQNATGQVRPRVLMHNKTASIDRLYNDLEKIQPTFGAAATGKTVTLQSSAHAPGLLIYAARFDGAAAERTDAQWKTLLQTLGWSPQFS